MIMCARFLLRGGMTGHDFPSCFPLLFWGEGEQIAIPILEECAPNPLPAQRMPAFEPHLFPGAVRFQFPFADIERFAGPG